METKLWIFVLAATAAILGISVWQDLHSGTAPASRPMRFIGNERNVPVPTRAELTRFQAQAENACRCARLLPEGDGGRQACWQDFERSIARYEHNDSAMPCMPLSSTHVCFGGGDLSVSSNSNTCVVRDPGGGACTAEEAQTLDRIWSDAMRNSADPQASQRANARMNAAVQAFIRGERVSRPRAPAGCSG